MTPAPLVADFCRFLDLLRALYVGEHNSFGVFHRCLTGPGRFRLEPWLDDAEHGLVHGLMTAFWATRQIGFVHTPESECLLAECLVHDFMRCHYGLITGHDAALRDPFPGLGEAAYTHQSRPDRTHPLVEADRIELYRYPDADAWVDPAALPIAMDGAIRRFFRHTRPAIAALVLGRDAVWLRHGREGADLIDESVHWRGRCTPWLPERGGRHDRAPDLWPHTYWGTGPDGADWAAEVGPLVALDEDVNKLIWPERYRLGGKVPVGLIRLDEALRAGASVGLARDHLTVRAAIPAARWLFVIEDPSTEPDLLNIALGHVPLALVLGLMAVVPKIVAVLRAVRGL